MVANRKALYTNGIGLLLSDALKSDMRAKQKKSANMCTGCKPYEITKPLEITMQYMAASIL